MADAYSGISLATSDNCALTNVTENGKSFAVNLADAEYLHNEDPQHFQIADYKYLHFVQVGVLVKVCTDWNRELDERFWVEVTHKELGADGLMMLWGQLRNNTCGAAYGAEIGPFYTRNMYEIGWDAYFDEIKSGDREIQTETARELRLMFIDVQQTATRFQ